MKASLLVLAFAIQAVQEPGPWRIVFEQKEWLKSVRENGTEIREEGKAPVPRGVPSPDKKRMAYLDNDVSHEQLWISDADGKNPRKLTDGAGIDGLPAWTPDGASLVFCSNRGGSWQIWVVGADGSDLRRLTDHKDGAKSPRVAPKGDLIAFLEVHPSAEKLPPATLRTLAIKSGESKVLLEKDRILGFSWSPQGDRLACSRIGEVRVLDIATGAAIHTQDLAEIKVALKGYAAYSMVWRPDGQALACSMRFLGGRMMGSKMFGDNELFVLPLKGKPVVIEAGGPASPVRWIR